MVFEKFPKVMFFFTSPCPSTNYPPSTIHLPSTINPIRRYGGDAWYPVGLFIGGGISGRRIRKLYLSNNSMRARQISSDSRASHVLIFTRMKVLFLIVLYIFPMSIWFKNFSRFNKLITRGKPYRYLLGLHNTPQREEHLWVAKSIR